MTKTYIDELVEEIARLREQNNKLNEMCNYWSIEETERTMECYKLKQLLKDVRNLWNGTVFMPTTQQQVQEVLSRIDEALK